MKVDVRTQNVVCRLNDTGCPEEQAVVQNQSTAFDELGENMLQRSAGAAIEIRIEVSQAVGDILPDSRHRIVEPPGANLDKSVQAQLGPHSRYRLQARRHRPG